jgi:hypothetical protein
MLSSFSRTGYPGGRQLRTVPSPACRSTLRPPAGGPKLWYRLWGYLLWVVADLLEVLYYLDMLSSGPANWLGLICEANTCSLVAKSTQPVNLVARQQESAPATRCRLHRAIVPPVRLPWLAASQRHRGFPR